MTILYNKKERAFFYACTYLSALFVSTIILWYAVLIGGNPLTFKSAAFVDDFGTVIHDIRPGQPVGVSREVCSSKEVGVEFFPALRDVSNGMLYPLPSGMIQSGAGCAKRTYAFTVPNVPAGDYVYQSAIRYQANLVGRDEMTTTPPVEVRVIR